MPNLTGQEGTSQKRWRMGHADELAQFEVDADGASLTDGTDQIPLKAGACNQQAGDYTALAADYGLGGALEYTGAGGNTFTLIDPSTLPAGEEISIVNDGTGALTVSPAAGTIDGGASLSLAAGESAILASDGVGNYKVKADRRVAVQSGTSVIQYSIDNAGATTPAVVPDIPAGAKVLSTTVDVTTAYDDAATEINILDADGNSLSSTSADENCPQEAICVENPNNRSTTLAGPPATTVTGASTVGAADVCIVYVE